MATPPVRPGHGPQQPGQRAGQRPARQGQRPGQQGQRPAQTRSGQQRTGQQGQGPGQQRSGQQGQRPAPGPPQRQPASPPLQQRAAAALMLAIIAIIGLILVQGNLRRAVVVVIVTLVIGATGLWLAFTSMSRARREGTARPRTAVLAAVAGVAATGLSALFLLAFALFWPQVTRYVDCLSGANTVATRAACEQQLSNSMQIGR